MKLATLCYVRKDGKTLMVHRNKKPNDMHLGKWNGLGGKLEPGETPEECCIRELYEETGLAVRNPQLKGLITFTAFSPVPSVMPLIGGAAASPSVCFALSDASGQASRLACFAASFMANARQVGCPHFLQLVFGSSLNISIPERAISKLLSKTSSCLAEKVILRTACYLLHFAFCITRVPAGIISSGPRSGPWSSQAPPDGA